MIAPLDGAYALQARDNKTDTDAEFRKEVLSGLARQCKAIPSKFFYDAEGSRLFERICELDEYYPTRTETLILRENSAAIAAVLPSRALLLEFGSGASLKVRLLLDALAQPVGYVPIDISREHLLAASSALAADYPQLTVTPVYADFSAPFRLPKNLPNSPRVGFFPGSTIGNFHPAEAISLLAGFAARLGERNSLLIGVDLKKDPRLLHAAYNDAEGVTAAFNLNLLRRINRELEGEFDLSAFDHQAVYDAEAGRIEMYLVSRRVQNVRVAGRLFRFSSGERIHTENSYKYGLEQFRHLSAAAGYHTTAVWMDPAELFSVHLLNVARS